MMIKNSYIYHILYTYFSARITLGAKIKLGDVKQIKHLFKPTAPDKELAIIKNILDLPKEERRKKLLAYAKFFGSMPEQK